MGGEIEAWLPWVIALGGGTGLGAGLKALADTVLALRAGVSAREGKRKADIVQQRDEAIRDATEADRKAEEERRRADMERARADWCETNMQIARANESRAREHDAEIRLLLMERGKMKRDELPSWPRMDDPVPRSEMYARREVAT